MRVLFRLIKKEKEMSINFDQLQPNCSLTISIHCYLREITLSFSRAIDQGILDDVFSLKNQPSINSLYKDYIDDQGFRIYVRKGWSVTEVAEVIAKHFIDVHHFEVQRINFHKPVSCFVEESESRAF